MNWTANEPPRVSRSVSTSSSARAAGGVDDEPAVLRIDPGARDAPAGEGASAQLFRRSHLDVAHLAASDRKSLLPGLHSAAFSRNLANDRARQQLLIHAERDQVLLIDRVEQSLRRRGRHPATALHVERAARLQCASGQQVFELGRGQGPVSGQAIDDEVLEPHGPERSEKGAQYTDARPLANR